jgi:hypothetical protein
MYLDDASKSILAFEVSIAWMYLDTKGNVTTAVGQLLPTAADAMRCPFHRPNAELATADEIRIDFERVRAMHPGRVASAYRTAQSLLLTEDTIMRMLHHAVVERATQLAAKFPSFDSFPDPVKIALLDITFNVGIGNLVNEFPLFTDAVDHEHWALAAQHCHRVGISEERNAWAKEQFMLVA